MKPTDVFALRQRYFANGYRPVAIQNGEKQPRGIFAMEWTAKARRDPPHACHVHPLPDALSTGILCDFLSAIDIDIDDPDRAAGVRQWLIQQFGDTMTRYRENSGRLLMLYASETDRSKVTHLHDPDRIESVEILGHGNQFVSDGRHPSGSPYLWRNGSPETVQRADLPCLTDEQVQAFIAFCEAFLGIPPRPPRMPSIRLDIGDSDGDEFIGDVVAALAEISHLADADYPEWFEIACAVWAATWGSAGGYNAFCNWSMGSPRRFNESACDKLWSSLSSRSNGFTAATLFYRVKEVNPDWVKPSQTFTPLRIFNKKDFNNAEAQQGTFC